VRWIDPDTFALCGQGDDVPPCPVCLAPIEIDVIDVSTWEGPAFIEGRWECPNGCDPRRGDPRYVGR
jgi:hypothetical protein